MTLQDAVNRIGLVKCQELILATCTAGLMKKLPFQNDQYGATFGGPIAKSKTHFFFNFERQTTPQTIALRSAAGAAGTWK